MKTISMLNLGCGSRYRLGPFWENINYPGWPPLVKSVDLRHPLPYASETFDFVYSSHVLDHFALSRVRSLLIEIRQMLRPKGVLRLSVPDLARNAENYLRSLRENDNNPLKHRWHTIELIDQMARADFGGEKGRFLRMARSEPDVQSWLRPLLGFEMREWLDQKDTPQVAWQTLLRDSIKKLMGRAQRFEHSGERHLWAFDEISLRYFLLEAGFARVERATWDRTFFPAYGADNLDTQDGAEYKPGSLYMEAMK